MVPVAFATVSSFLARIGVCALVTKNYIWLGENYIPVNRINASFVDANIYARFLLIGCLATAALELNATRKGRLIGAVRRTDVYTPSGRRNRTRGISTRHVNNPCFSRDRGKPFPYCPDYDGSRVGNIGLGILLSFSYFSMDDSSECIMS